MVDNCFTIYFGEAFALSRNDLGRTIRKGIVCLRSVSKVHGYVHIQGKQLFCFHLHFYSH